jgi:hypothetical protein
LGPGRPWSSQEQQIKIHVSRPPPPFFCFLLACDWSVLLPNQNCHVFPNSQSQFDISRETQNHFLSMSSFGRKRSASSKTKPQLARSVFQKLYAMQGTLAQALELFSKEIRAKDLGFVEELVNIQFNGLLSGYHSTSPLGIAIEGLGRGSDISFFEGVCGYLSCVYVC